MGFLGDDKQKRKDTHYEIISAKCEIERAIRIMVQAQARIDMALEYLGNPSHEKTDGVYPESIPKSIPNINFDSIHQHKYLDENGDYHSVVVGAKGSTLHFLSDEKSEG